MTEREIFTEALRRLDLQQRAAFLDEACRGESALRQQVESLLAEHEQLGSFLEDRPVALLAQPIAERPGMQIGPYKLLQQIGEGGMGVVFMAEQLEPIRRKVALKVIKPGMDSRQVIARFEVERQSLALMDHVNIARVLDAGASEAGRPYFVMELVHGVPITSYCDENRLTPRQRLQLFLPVCLAIQHAHQKGMIHRDIKPSNVMITQYDAQPVPKVIDFGVAKAIQQPLAQQSLFTQYGTLIGTLEYMSPEQAEFNAQGVDTRSDIYSLGVLLYELLTGSTPLDRKRMQETAYAEVLRLIKEQEPLTPSTRLSESGVALATISAQRQTEPAKLSRMMRGELDWIVMKTLEKDRNRRYETVEALAADVQRYLSDEPVLACPPSTSYRFRRFARRNRASLAVGFLLALSMIVALGGITAGIGWAARDRTAREAQSTQEQATRQAKVTVQLEQILSEVERLERSGRWAEALTAARRAEPGLATGEAAPEIQQQVSHALVDLELIRRLEEIRSQTGTAWGDVNTRQSYADRADQEYADALQQVGIDVDTQSVEHTAHQIASHPKIAAALLPALDDWVAVRSVREDQAAARRLIEVLNRADRDPWRRQVRDALARQDWASLEELVVSAEIYEQQAPTLTFLAATLRVNHKHALEEVALRHAQWKNPSDFWINHRLGISLAFGGSRELILEGIGYLRAAVAIRPDSANAMMNLGNGFAFLGQHDKAIECYQRSLVLSPNSFGCYCNLGVSLMRKGSHDEAATAFERAMRLSPTPDAETCAELSMIHSNRPQTHLRNIPMALELAEKAIEIDSDFRNHCIALGVARYRQGLWQHASIAMEKSLRGSEEMLRGSICWEEAISWFFLAMCHWQLGQKNEAGRCYETGVMWMDNNKPPSLQLIRVRAEAEALLGVTEEPSSNFEVKPPT